MYNTKIMEVFANPKNVGLIRGAQGVGEYKNQQNGEIIRIYASIENGVIKQSKFKAFGNALLIAVGSIITEYITGKDINDLNNITVEEVLNEIGEIPPYKDYCIQMCVFALSDLVADYIKKQEKLLKQLEKTNKIV